MESHALRVLLVEDNPTDALLVRDALETITSAQFEVTHVDSLGESLNQLRNAPFDITLLDPGLPDSQGLETCSRLHANARGVPIIILTNNNDEKLALRAIETGAQDYLVKGKIDENILIRAIRYAIERKRAEVALRESEARYRTLVEHAPFCIHELDLNGRFLSVNSSGIKMVNLIDEQQLIGVPYLDWVSHEDHDRVQALLLNASQGNSSEFEFKMTSERPARVIAASFIPIKNQNGVTQKIMGISQDITDSKAKEEERLRSNKLESVGILAGGIAHDFNNILTGILGNISLGKVSVNSSAHLFKLLTEAERASLRAKDLTQQLLTFAKGGAPIKTLTSIGKFIKESAEFALSGSNVRCKFLLPESLWPVEIDEGQMNQVINNLVINAQQAMPTGGHITIQGENLSIGAEVSNQHSSIQAGDYVKISVADQGIGIPEHHLSRIFDPYFTTKDKGNGLGLATTYAVVKNHDGHIMVESELGVGTTFCLYVLASPEAVLARKDETATLKTGHGKLLVMDDEPAIRELLKRILTHLGYTVEVTCDGAEAIELYKRAQGDGQPFAAAIMDLTIPGGIGGKDAVQKLQEINPGVRTIVSSGYSTDPTMGDFKAYGFNGVITKPYTIVEVSRTVHQVLYSRNE